MIWVQIADNELRTLWRATHTDGRLKYAVTAKQDGHPVRPDGSQMYYAERSIQWAYMELDLGTCCAGAAQTAGVSQ
jgi:hypothetical protein